MVFGLGTLGTIGLAMTVGGFGGAVVFYNAMPESTTRRDLRNAFQAADVGLKVTKGYGKNKRTITRYPVIKRITVHSDKRQVEFSVPTGMNPDEIENNYWLLHQTFGEELELDVKQSKFFTLDIYKKPLETFPYDITQIKKAIEGKGFRLPVFAGMGRKGAVVFDLTVHPHIIIAGVTGSGKSVCLHGLLVTFILLMRNEIELYCADMKMTEFHIYRDIAEKVVVRPNNLGAILLYIRSELNRRGALCEKAGVQAIWNLPKASRPKYIILAIDEVAELRGSELDKESQDLYFSIIERIQSQGRALGVYNIMSMHRPDSTIINGRIKNNSTIRMAFRHADETNSRVTLDTGDAAKLKNSDKGKMYLSYDGIKQVQSPFLDVEDTEALSKLLAPFKKGASINTSTKKADLEKASGVPEKPPADYRSNPLPEPPVFGNASDRFAQLMPLGGEPPALEPDEGTEEEGSNDDDIKKGKMKRKKKKDGEDNDTKR